MHRIILLLLIFQIFGLQHFQVLNAQDARFFIETDRSEIAEGETFVLNIVLENLDGKNLQTPDMAPFKIVQGPSTSSSVTIINGKRSGTQSYQYLLLAGKKGKYNIGPATIAVGSKTLKSNILNIEVVAGRKQSTDLQSNVSSETFVRLEMNSSKAFVGQQLTLNLVLYTRNNIESFQLLNEPTFDGFYSQPLNDIRDQPRNVSIKGKEYYTQVVRRWALFPQKTGDYNLGPVNCNLDIAVDNGQSSFFFRDTKRETVTSNVLKTSILNLPSPAPESFTGAVGNFTMSATIKKPTVVTGEGITLTMQIEGEGDSRIVQAPAFELPYGFEQYSPSVTKEETYQRGDKIMMKKEFEYILVPSVDSTFTINPVFSYYDLTSNTYKSISNKPFTIHVVIGDADVQSKSEQNTSSNTFTKISTDEKLYHLKKGYFGSNWYFLSLIAIGLGFIIAYYYKFLRKPASDIDQKPANSIDHSLDAASSYLSERKHDLFYQEIARACDMHMEKKYGIKPSTDDKEMVIKLLMEKGATTPSIEKYNLIRSAIDLARYAGVNGNMEDILLKTKEWLNAD